MLFSETMDCAILGIVFILIMRLIHIKVVKVDIIFAIEEMRNAGKVSLVTYEHFSNILLKDRNLYFKSKFIFKESDMFINNLYYNEYLKHKIK